MFIARFVTERVLDWAVASQQTARRNALISSTQLAERRRERIDVEEFLAAHQLAFAARTANAERLLIRATG
jgi:hypothetical protein